MFPAQDGLAERDLAYWRWQFEQNTLARTEVAVAIAGGRVVGQYAAVPQRALDEGGEITTGLVVDAFVLPEYRRAGSRPGIIIHLARDLHDCWCGPRARLVDRGHSLLYGYPFPIWRIAQRHLASEIVRDMDVLFSEIAVPGFVPVASPNDVEVVEIDDVVAAADAVWASVVAETRFGLVRDGRYLDWRYVRHPQKRYRVFLARGADGVPRGLAVYHQGRYTVDAGIVCDWIVPAADEAAENALLAALQARAAEDGTPVLLSVFPQNDPRFLRWQRKGFLVGPPSHFLVMNTFGHHVRYLRDRWFFTLGDSDLV